MAENPCATSCRWFRVNTTWSQSKWPAENRVRYCYHCGRRVETERYEEPEGGGE